MRLIILTILTGFVIAILLIVGFIYRVEIDREVADFIEHPWVGIALIWFDVIVIYFYCKNKFTYDTTDGKEID